MKNDTATPSMNTATQRQALVAALFSSLKFDGASDPVSGVTTPPIRIRSQVSLWLPAINAHLDGTYAGWQLARADIDPVTGNILIVAQGAAALKEASARVWSFTSGIAAVIG